MRRVPEHFEKLWQAGDFSGPNKATRRVTIQRPLMRLDSFELMTTYRRVSAVYGAVPSSNPYPSGIDPTKGERVTQTYADYLFTAPGAPMELPNVSSISWTRSVDVDTAQATIEFWNNQPLPVGQRPKNGELDQPGYFSPGRGTSPFSSRWDHKPNDWTGLLMPDNILRTYEGWGSDNPESAGIGGDGYVPPEKDSRLVLTGVWIIDSVEMTALGSVVVTARDPGRLLLDHSAMIPVIPDDFYPVTFKDWGDKVTVLSKRQEDYRATQVDRVNATHRGSGNDLWPESAYTGAKVYGHSSTHALDGKQQTYYLSVGNPSPGYRSAYEYVDVNVDATISEVRFTTVKSGYNAYVSIKTRDGWVNGKTMPYRRDGRGRYEEGVPYVASKGGLKGEGTHTISFKPVERATMVRLWLGNLPNFGLPGAKYRAGIREIQVWGPRAVTRKRTVVDSNQVGLTPGPAGSNPGRCQDYTDIVKLFCAWAGLYWPQGGYEAMSDGSIRALSPKKPDRVLGAGVQGRVWGDFQATGTAPVAEIVASAFDKKTLMDGVRYVADILGFGFWFDETGAAQWRLPNIWGRGNWINGTASSPGRTNEVVTIDERKTIIGLSATIQSANVREGVFVANPVGKFAAMVPGYNPNPTGLRRVGGWTDQHFESVDEARVMADLVTVRQLFRYRQDRITIPAHPAIQIDDQVRIFERVTSEGYYHYVQGISSQNDAQNGQWTYTLQTHWLGDDPNGKWAFDKSALSSVTIAHVDALQGGTEYVRAGLEG